MQIKPTRWPILDFHLNIWKLNIGTAIMRDNAQFRKYEFIRLEIYWGNKQLAKLDLYDTWERVEARENERN
jgi:hypothetical protein